MKILLVGPGASGKDYFADYLISQGLIKAIDFTTRPQRNSNDNSYHFVNHIKENKCYYIFKVQGKNWLYGYSKNELLNSDFCILPPAAIESAVSLLNDLNIPHKIIYFNIPETIRALRLSSRTDGDVQRRLKTDYLDFQNFNTFDIQIKDAFFKPNTIINIKNIKK